MLAKHGRNRNVDVVQRTSATEEDLGGNLNSDQIVHVCTPKGDSLESRYLGFEQLGNIRSYRFDVMEPGHAARHCTITVDVSLLVTHRVSLQDGPGLCANKLLSDLRNNLAGPHELTTADLSIYAIGRNGTDAQPLDSRRAPRKHKPTPAQTPWRNTRL